jgi:hypothetical protein
VGERHCGTVLTREEVGFGMDLSQRQHELLRVAANAPDGAIWAGKDLGGKRPLRPVLEDLVRRGLMVQAGEKWSITLSGQRAADPTTLLRI